MKVYRVYRWSSRIGEGKGGPGLSLAVVRDLREARVPAGPDELLAFETDVLAGFVLARAAADLSDNTIRSDVLHLEQLRAWFGGPLRDMEPADADAYFGRVLRDAAKGTRLARMSTMIVATAASALLFASPTRRTPITSGFVGQRGQNLGSGC
jgi:hypothetical protein